MRKSKAVKLIEHNLDLLRVKSHLSTHIIAKELLDVIENLGFKPPDYIEKNANTTTSGWEEEIHM